MLFGIGAGREERILFDTGEDVELCGTYRCGKGLTNDTHACEESDFLIRTLD